MWPKSGAKISLELFPVLKRQSQIDVTSMGKLKINFLEAGSEIENVSFTYPASQQQPRALSSTINQEITLEAKESKSLSDEEDANKKIGDISDRWRKVLEILA